MATENMFNDEITDLNQACRSCLRQTNDMKSLFDQYSTYMCIADVFVYVTSLEFSGDADDLPTQICNTCFTDLTTSYTFVTKSQESHKQLQNQQKTTNFHHIDIKQEIDDSNDALTSIDPIPPPETSDTQLDIIKHEIDINHDDYTNYRNECHSPPNTITNQTTNNTSNTKTNNCTQCNLTFSTYSALLTHYTQIEHENLNVLCRFCPETHDSTNIYAHNHTSHSKPLEPPLNQDNSITIDSFTICTQCNLKFETNNALLTHYSQIRHERLDVICQFCLKTYDSNDINTHIHFKHTNRDKTITIDACKQCDIEFATYDALLSHYSQIEHDALDVVCRLCAETHDANQINDHIHSVHDITQLKTPNSDTPSTNYNCAQCDTKFRTYKLLLMHYRELEHDNLEVVCRFCSKPYDANDMYAHILTTHPIKQPNILESNCDNSTTIDTCSQCDVKFDTYEALLVHYHEIKHDNLDVICPYCSNTYNANDIRAHIDSTHFEDINELETPNCDNSITNDSCTVCGLRFEHKGNLKRHMAIHTGEKLHVCDVCDKSFNRKESMTYHMLSHTGKQPYLFPVPDKFINKALITHKVIHIKRTQYSCAICDKAFNHKGKVRRHMLTHTGQKPYSCDVCDKSFNQKENLSRHILTHSGHKPHACTKCERSFTHKENLTYHMATHVEQKAYVCTQCDKSFIQKTKLSRHLLTHATQRPYSCEICNKSFIKIGNLNRHLITHTN